jgi:N-acetylglutamate synthase-like GNAT family acetyltransferase
MQGPQTGFTVRLAGIGDADAVSELLTASYRSLMTGYYDPGVLAAALPIITQANPALLESGTYYCVVDRRGLLVGCGGWTRRAPGGAVGSGAGVEDRGHLRHFATHPDYVRRGVGASVAERCFYAAADAGLSALECFASLNAERFYARLGFKRIDVRDVLVGGKIAFPSVLMRRALSSQGSAGSRWQNR